MICPDASVAAKLILVEEYAEQAGALYQAARQANERIVAPDLLPFEVTNILRQRLRRTSMQRDEASARLEDFLGADIDIDILCPAGMHRRALILADTHGLPAADDAHYLALAQDLGCDFWTGDRR